MRGYKEEGTTTTPFDMTVLNDLDRFHLAGDVVDRVPRLTGVGAHFKQWLRDKLVEHKQYIDEHGDDMPEIEGVEVGRLSGAMRILALNGGSSSFKAAVFDGPELREVWTRRGGRGVARLLDGAPPVDAVGHRIVHGGRSFQQSTRITPEVKAEIARLSSFAPEHNLLEVEGIEAAARIFGAAVPQVAVFDTAFHSTMPPEAYVYPGPYSWLDEGIRRYGFHGISHQYVSRRAAEVLGQAAGVAADGDVPSGRRMLAGGGAGRPVGGHDDGVHAARRADDGDALGVGGSGHPDSPGAALRVYRGGPGSHSESRVGTEGRVGSFGRYARGRGGDAGRQRTRAARVRRFRAPAVRRDRVDGGERGRAGRAGVHGGNRGEFGGGAVGGMRAIGMAGRVGG